MTTVEILKAMSEDGMLILDVLGYLDAGMRNEWDCGLYEAAEYGFGMPELRIAARAGYQAAEYDEMRKEAEYDEMRKEMVWEPERTGNKWRIVGNNDAADMITVEALTPLFRTKHEAQDWIDKSLKSHLPKE